jgi:hypothetical protein
MLADLSFKCERATRGSCVWPGIDLGTDCIATINKSGHVCHETPSHLMIASYREPRVHPRILALPRPEVKREVATDHRRTLRETIVFTILLENEMRQSPRNKSGIYLPGLLHRMVYITRAWDLLRRVVQLSVFQSGWCLVRGLRKDWRSALTTTRNIGCYRAHSDTKVDSAHSELYGWEPVRQSGANLRQTS